MNKLDSYISQLKNSPNFNDWILSLATTYVSPEEKIRSRENLVRGCETELWITGHEEDSKWVFVYDTNTMFTKATAKVVTDCCSELSSTDIQGIDFMDFSEFAQYLSFNRKRGIQLMLNHIKTIVDRQ